MFEAFEHNPFMASAFLIDAVVDEYLPLLDALSDQMDSLEDQIFADFQAEAVEDIFRIKKELLILRRAVTPLRDVFNTLLRREQPLFSRETHTYFQDVFDHLIRVADTIDTLRDMIGSMMDAYLSISGNRYRILAIHFSPVDRSCVHFSVFGRGGRVAEIREPSGVAQSGHSVY